MKHIAFDRPGNVHRPELSRIAGVGRHDFGGYFLMTLIRCSNGISAVSYGVLAGTERLSANQCDVAGRAGRGNRAAHELLAENDPRLQRDDAPQF